MKQSNKKSLEELSSEDIVKACEENYENFWRATGKSTNAEFSDDRGITQCITGIPQDIFNVVLKCNLNERDIESRIDEAIDYFRFRRIPLLWHTGLLSEPKDIGSYLEARGFPHDYDLAAMAVDLNSIEEEMDLPKEISVRLIENESECKQWAECLASSWGSPKVTAAWLMDNACFNTRLEQGQQLSLPRKMYLGYLNGKPAGTSMLVWNDDVAGLEMVGTVPDSQYKGVGTAIVKTILRDAHMMGFEFVVVLATIEGARLYEKCGFREYGKLPEHSMNFQNIGI